MPDPAPAPPMVTGPGPLKRLMLPAWAWWVVAVGLAIVVVGTCQIIFSVISDRILPTAGREQPFGAAAPAEDRPAAAAAPAAEMAAVEGVSWFPGEPFMDALIAEFQEQYQDTEFIHNSDIYPDGRASLDARLQAGDPPDSFQVHAGQELIGNYVDAGQVEPLNFLYEENGWFEFMPQALIEHVTQDGRIYAVPVNIHRTNVLWANPSVLEENGLEMPGDLQQCLATMDTLQDAGMEAPLALGRPWAAFHLFETVLLASLGSDAYNALWDGRGDWNSREVTQAIEDFESVLSYANSHELDLDWVQAGQRVIEGDAAFYVMGDWLESYFREQGYDPGGQYRWAPVPGTSGNFQFVSDSFVLPAGAPHREAAIAWLTVAGSQGGQDAFNPLKGSIPARSDGNPRLYNEYQHLAMDNWATDTAVGSLAHGIVANDKWKGEIEAALGRFLDNRDTAAFQQWLVMACTSYGTCG